MLSAKKIKNVLNVCFNYIILTGFESCETICGSF